MDHVNLATVTSTLRMDNATVNNFVLNKSLDCSCSSGMCYGEGQFEEIYVNSLSREELELGTKRYPYTQLQTAFIEIFNQYAGTEVQYQILIMENTINQLQNLNQQTSIFNMRNLTIKQNLLPQIFSTYTLDNDKQKPGFSTIFVNPQVSYSYNKCTKFVLMTQIYDVQPGNRIGKLSSRELLTLRYQDNFIEANDQRRLFFFHDIQNKTITFDKVQFNAYGKIMKSLNPINIKMLNSELITDWINEENITFEHITSQNNFIYLNTNQNTVMRIDNLRSYNASQVNSNNLHYFISSQGTVDINGLSIVNSKTTVRAVIIVGLTPTIIINNFEFINNTFDEFSTSSCIFKGSSTLYTATIYLNNLRFQNNIMNGYQAIQQASGIKSFFINNSVFSNENSYLYKQQAMIVIYNSLFSKNSFNIQGDIILVQQNSLNATRILNSTFKDNVIGGINLKSGDIGSLNYPTIIEIANCTFLNNKPKYSTFIKQSSNTMLRVNNSQFNKTIGLNRGSVLLQDYENAKATFMNSVFFGNKAVYGGILYSQYSGTIIFVKCHFSYNFAEEAGIGDLINAFMGMIILENIDIQDSYISLEDPNFILMIQSYLIIRNVKVENLKYFDEDQNETHDQALIELTFADIEHNAVLNHCYKFQYKQHDLQEQNGQAYFY
ncbi:UNKNOWN [Stylonychia lemnae]|uniref:Right handed beta helix domain-containing protein n=1 Tax=Stylonychia lemnae TaxID=5949 RepID=A0A078ANR8_STYLE|nr:UNKNOWN [Stylonychia lemnae]|eukprot:CDW82608.1 UNKNOWN [Stylonychia lemnae]